MEQKDYILREIEKIGLILNYIREKLFSGKATLSISVDNQIKDLNGMLLNEDDFDLNMFLSLSTKESNEYISSYKGFSIENMEKLAGCITEICLEESTADSKKYLEKALQLYEFCNLKSKTYSIEREKRIKEIQKVL